MFLGGLNNLLISVVIAYNGELRELKAEHFCYIVNNQLQVRQLKIGQEIKQL